MACNDCKQLTQRIVELELRVRTLLDIRETEDFIDSMLPSPEAKLPANEPPLEPAFSPPAVGPDESWPALGAKPKRPSAASTFIGDGTGTKFKQQKKRGRNSSRITSPPVTLRNSFEPLGTLSPLCVESKAKRHRSASHSANKHEGPRSPTHHDGSYYTHANPTHHRLLRPGVPHFTPSPSRTTRGAV